MTVRCPSKHVYGTLCEECHWCGVCGGTHVPFAHGVRPEACPYASDHTYGMRCSVCGWEASLGTRRASMDGPHPQDCQCVWCEEQPVARLFNLVREQDITGISGTGIVAEGVRFSDGTTVLRWLKAGTARPDQVKPTTVIHESVESVEALHGHNGATRIVWLP